MKELYKEHPEKWKLGCKKRNEDKQKKLKQYLYLYKFKIMIYGIKIRGYFRLQHICDNNEDIKFVKKYFMNKGYLITQRNHKLYSGVDIKGNPLKKEDWIKYYTKNRIDNDNKQKWIKKTKEKRVDKK